MAEPDRAGPACCTNHDGPSSLWLLFTLSNQTVLAHFNHHDYNYIILLFNY